MLKATYSSGFPLNKKNIIDCIYNYLKVDSFSFIQNAI